jgi:hypothetical protein
VRVAAEWDHSPSVTLQCLLQKRQSSSENLALVINRTAQAMPLTVDFHKHLRQLAAASAGALASLTRAGADLEGNFGPN